LQIWCTVHGFAHLLLESQIAPPEDGGPRAGRLPDIAGLLLPTHKPRRTVSAGKGRAVRSGARRA
jgi:hypothetical protein